MCLTFIVQGKGKRKKGGGISSRGMTSSLTRSYRISNIFLETKHTRSAREDKRQIGGSIDLIVGSIVTAFGKVLCSLPRNTAGRPHQHGPIEKGKRRERGEKSG